jgi:polar amino acid transport system permease protein
MEFAVIDFDLVINSLPILARGAIVSLQIAAMSCVIGFSLGTLLGILQTNKRFWVRALVTFYTTIIRGTPMLIQIYFIFFLLPELGVKISAFWSAILAIGLNSGAYVSSIIRSGIAAVGRGQIEAAKVLGLNHLQIMRFIVLPQAVRVVLPALGNEFVTLIKDSSLASLIGVAELSREGSLIKSRTYDALSVYLAVALIYLVMTSLLSLALSRVEKRMNRHVSHQ